MDITTEVEAGKDALQLPVRNLAAEKPDIVTTRGCILFAARQIPAFVGDGLQGNVWFCWREVKVGSNAEENRKSAMVYCTNHLMVTAAKRQKIKIGDAWNKR